MSLDSKLLKTKSTLENSLRESILELYDLDYLDKENECADLIVKGLLEEPEFIGLISRLHRQLYRTK